MVETRSQKRKLDDDDENSLIINEMNIDCKIKKKKISSFQEKNENEQSDTFNTHDLDETENYLDETEQYLDKTDDESYDELSDKKLEKNILNLKFKPDQIETIIKDSIKTIVKRYTREGKDFLNKKEHDSLEYDTFHELVDSIYNGEFFERVPLEDRTKKLKESISKEEIKKLTQELENIRNKYNNNSPSVIDILKMNVSLEQKQKLLEKVYCLINSEILTPDYNSNLKFLTSNISNSNEPELIELEEKILKSSLNSGFADSYRTKILKSKMSFENKVIAYKKLEIMETYEESDTSEYAKYKAWMDSLLSVPFGVYNESDITKESSLENIKEHIKNVRVTLDCKLSFLEKPKDQIINIVTQMIRNPNININAIGLHGGPGLGKCMGFNTPIIMFDGTIKMIQDIQIGDLVMGDDSTPRTVLALGRGKDTMYKITNVKGESYTVNSEHILCLKYSNSKNISDDKKYKRFIVKWFNNKEIKIYMKNFYYKNKDKNVILKEAREFLNNLKEDKICEIPIKKYLKLTKSIKDRLKGYSVPIKFSEKELEVDPYMIGIWLGDGSQDGTVISNKESTIIKYLKENLEQYKCYLQYKEGYDYIINGPASNHFLNILGKYNLIKNKHIPYIYKCNSRENRLKLLAGLIDTDGSLNSNKSRYEFSQPLEHEQLIDDIVYLARSLGFACYKNKKKTSWIYKGIKNYSEVWTICISGRGIEEIPVLCPRKKANSRQQIKDVLLSGIRVEELPEDNYYGFELDNNHRYVLGNFIVTHNTSIAQSIALSLNRPFRMISLGGESDASSLTGHGFTYVGSGSGRLINTLIDTKTMNPVILIDECDKISETQHGKEIIGTLIHLTDSTTNSKYNYDKYFSGIEFDLSKVLFIFTYNNPNKIDKILADRLFKIKVDNYSFKEKIEITKKHIISNILNKFNFKSDDISFSEEAITYIVSSCKSEGMREIKTKINIILSRINTLLFTNEEDNIVKLNYKKLYPYYKSLPVVIPDKHIDILFSESITTEKGNEPPPHMYV
jgi:ATP-dependent Lon protease